MGGMTPGVDTLDFSAYGYTDISDLTLSVEGANVRVTADAGESVLLSNIDIVDLDNSDFIWAQAPIQQKRPPVRCVLAGIFYRPNSLGSWAMSSKVATQCGANLATSVSAQYP